MSGSAWTRVTPWLRGVQSQGGQSGGEREGTGDGQPGHIIPGASCPDPENTEGLMIPVVMPKPLDIFSQPDISLS